MRYLDVTDRVSEELFTMFQGMRPLRENASAASPKLSDDVTQSPMDAPVDVIQVGPFKGRKFKWVGEPYGIPGTRGVVPNTKSYKRFMDFQEKWSVSSDVYRGI